MTVVAAVLYVAPLLLDAPLTDPDEGLHAAISQEMRERGDLIVPRFLGRAFFDKPVLFFWAQIASISALGMNTAAARLPGFLFALLGIATTGWAARVLFNSLTGWAAVACYATMVLPFMLAQAPVHDIALVPLTNIALACLWRARAKPTSQSPNSKSQRRSVAGPSSLGLWVSGFGFWDLLVAGLALGLSILTKGLEGVAIVGVAYGLFLLLTRSVTTRIVWQGIVVLAIAFVVAVPWYVAMEGREPGYLRYYFVDRHFLGFATDTQRHAGQPWWFYLPLVLGGGLPWILYVRAPRREDGQPDTLLWTWLAGALALLSLSGSKAVTYVLPVMPAIAILAARSWATVISVHPHVDPLRVRRLVHAALFTVIVALTPWAAGRFGGHRPGGWEHAALGVLSVAWVWLVVALRRSQAASAWPRLVVVTATTYALAFALLAPPLAQAHSSRDLAGYFSAPESLPKIIYVMDQRVSFVYYLRPEVRQALRADQIRSVSVEQLSAMHPFPHDAVVALPADLVGRLSRVDELKGARRHPAGRYVVVTP